MIDLIKNAKEHREFIKNNIYNSYNPLVSEIKKGKNKGKIQNMQKTAENQNVDDYTKEQKVSKKKDNSNYSSQDDDGDDDLD